MNNFKYLTWGHFQDTVNMLTSNFRGLNALLTFTHSIITSCITNANTINFIESGLHCPKSGLH